MTEPTRNEQLTAELTATIAAIRGGKTVNVQLGVNIFGGAQFVRLEEVRYGDNGRLLKPNPLVSAVIVGPHAETLRTIATLLEKM